MRPKNGRIIDEKRAQGKGRKVRHGRQVQFEQPLGRKPFYTENLINLR
jgi:hypothetical protein